MSVDYYKNTMVPNTRIKRLAGRIHLFFNACPRCGGSAPAVDCCVVCRNIHANNEWGTIEPNRRQQYPPSPATKALWWYCWLHPAMERLQREIHDEHVRELSKKGATDAA